jgi:DNA transposition AAA+ family ATPase
MSAVPENNSVTSLYRGDAELQRQVAALIDLKSDLTQAIVSRESGVGSGILSQWLQGKYPGDNESIDSKMRIWLDAHLERAAAERMPQAPAYVDTPTAQRVLAALSYAQIAGDIAMAYGGAGLGKTTACEQYQRSNPSVWIATMEPASAGVVTCLQVIVETLGLPASGGALALAHSVKKRVRGTSGLIIVDEAQHLSAAALDQIRSIHDATGIGIAFVGNEGLYSRMAGGRNAVQLDRLFSRVGKRLALRQSTDADIKALIKAWGINDSKCLPALIEIAKRPGALRGLTKTLRLAAMQAMAEQRDICCQDVRAAARELGTSS